MGNASARPTALPDSRSSFGIDLPKFVLQTKTHGRSGCLSDSKFMKSYCMRADGTNMVVKVYMKLSDEDLTKVQEELHRIFSLLSPNRYPNLLPYQMWIRSQANAVRQKVQVLPIYLVRQYLASNLYDRMLTRPFLTETEKMWMIFQLFYCVEIAHGNGVVHGDIKPDNVLCTSWNFLILTDFAPHKPVNIPNDDPTDFQYFFDGSGRRSCYVAPERFTSRESLDRRARAREPGPGLTEAMDVFSLACTIAEVFLDSKTALLDLPAMLSYLGVKEGGEPLNTLADGGDAGPAGAVLSRITHRYLRDVIVHATQLAPENRLTVSQYKEVLQGCANEPLTKAVLSPITRESPPAFPAYFEASLQPLFFRLHWEGSTPDKRVCILCEMYGTVVRSIIGEKGDDEGHEALQRILADVSANVKVGEPREDINDVDGDPVQRSGGMTSKEMVVRERYMRSASRRSFHSQAHKESHTDEEPKGAGAVDLGELIQQCEDFISSVDPAAAAAAAAAAQSTAPSAGEEEHTQGSDDAFSCILEDILSKRQVHGLAPREVHPGLTILVQLVNSTFRHLQYCESRIATVLLLVRLGSMCEDEVILKRILPSLLLATEDNQNAQVRAAAIRAVAVILSLVQEVAAVDEDIFPTYIFPALNRALKDQDVAVRVAFAASVGLIAESSKRFLDRAHFAALRKTVRGGTLTGPPSTSGSSANLTAEADKDSSTSLDVSPPPPPLAQRTASVLDSNVVEFDYTRRLHSLHDFITHSVKVLLNDTASTSDLRRGSGLCSSNSLVRRELISQVELLCAFLGRDVTISSLLPHLLTFFSDSDWELRLSFWEHVPSIFSFVGTTLAEAYIMPSIEHGLVDCEERVVVGTLRCLERLCRSRLLSLSVLLAYIKPDKVGALLVHPSEAIRKAASYLVVSVGSYAGPVDCGALVLPSIQMFLQYDISHEPITLQLLESALSPPAPLRPYRARLLKKQQEFLESTNRHPDGEDEGTEAKGSADSSSLEMMEAYIVLAAREVCAKSSLWRHALHSSLYSSPYAAALRRHSSINHASSTGTLDALLNLSTSSQSLAQALQTLLIPHQKFGAGFYFPLTEEQRALSDELKRIEDPEAVCALYGIAKNRYEAEKLLSRTNKDGLLASQLTVTSVDSRKPSTGTVTGSGAAQRTDSSKSSKGEEMDKGEKDSAGKSTVSRDFMSEYYQMDTTSLADLQRSKLLCKRITALGIPPLPPDVGALVQPMLADGARPQYYNGYVDVLDLPANEPRQQLWKPKEGVLMTSLQEHTKAVHRIAVSPDQSFFGSASADGTVKIWQLRGMDSTALPRSVLTYKRHRSPVNDITVLENSHAMASCSEDGRLHVWRVDVEGVTSGVPDMQGRGDNYPAMAKPGLGVVGMGVLRVLSPEEGPVLGVTHFNGEVGSLLTYITQNKGLHGWDMRSSGEAFSFDVPPELGHSSATCVAPDRSWLVVGTSRGFILFIDLRYNVLCKLWRHSSGSCIHRLACSRSMHASGGTNALQPTSSPALADTEGAYLFVAAGNNETAIFGLPEAGECLKCFRSVPLATSRAPLAPLPELEEVSLGSRHSRALPVFLKSLRPPVQPSQARDDTVRAMIGRTPSYLVTAGSDSMIRYWDFTSPAKCYTVAGLMAGQPKTIYEAPTDKGVAGRLFISYDSAIPGVDTTLPQHLPLRAGRGALVPNNAFRDAVLDIKYVDLPTRALVSCSRDGSIRIWK